MEREGERTGARRLQPSKKEREGFSRACGGYMKPELPSVGRRGFLKRAAAASAALAAPTAEAAPQPAVQRAAVPATPVMSAAAEAANPPDVEVLTADRTGSDFMVDVLKSLGFDYICANPGSSYRGIHESVINYGGNRSPELITCCHEESADGTAHGYAKVEGRPHRLSH